MTQSFSEQRYLDEIQAWQEASQIHARSAIEQYERVSQALEQVYFEKRQSTEILEQLSDAVIVLNKQQEIILWNNAAAHLFGFDRIQIIGQDFDIFFSDILPELTEALKTFKDSPQTQDFHQLFHYQQHYLDTKIRKIRITDETLILLLLEDITEVIQLQKKLEKEKALLEQRVAERTEVLKQAHQNLEQMVTTDRLTQLHNRLAFEEQLKNCHQQQLQNHHFQYALLFIDLDGFKLINDTLGHNAGDELLIQVAQRLKQVFRKTDFIARLGGDEFVVLLTEKLDRNTLKRIAKQAIEQIAAPYLLTEERLAHVTASIGICESQNIQTGNASEVLSMADHAMYQAKQHGKNRYEFFEAEMEASIKQSNSIAVKLIQAIDEGQFEPYFQPICLVNGEIIGAEVLARWPVEEGFVPPFQFIPLIEQKGLIHKFSLMLLKKVVHALQQNPHIPCVSFNLSVQQFHEEHFIDDILQCTESLRQQPVRISFEITESAFSQNSQLIIQKIQQLRAHGFRVYIDDFGTGYSAFSYLKKFQADVIKIDREFVHDIVQNENSRQLLYGITSLIHTLGMQTVIEGVETAEQHQLIQQKCPHTYIQGYYFYQPMPFSEFQNLPHA